MAEKKEVLNDLESLEKTTSDTLGGAEIKYKVLENADLLYKKYVTEIVSMPDSTYFTKKEVLKFLADIYNTL
tara:strand:+ start:398 stop:613 length:216 start_codon:yes stop_codon:yes gene_type:complete